MTPPENIVKPSLSDICPDCGYSFADCPHREARLKAIAEWTPPTDASNGGPRAPVPDEPTSNDIAPGEYPSYVQWRIDHPAIPWRTKTHSGRIEFQRDGSYTTVGHPNEDASRAKRSPQMGSHKAGSVEKIRQLIIENCGPLLGEDVVADAAADEKPVKARPAARAAKPEPPAPGKAKPTRRALSLPKESTGDPLLVLPTAQNVPPELLAEKRWVIWTAQWNDSLKKWRKPPRSPLTNEEIGPSLKWSAHFTDFETAVAGAEKFNASGIGLMFFKGDGRVAIDFDHCLTVVTEDRDVPGGHINSTSPAFNSDAWLWLDKWFSTTYQELSPSGDGIHIFCLGQLAKAVRKTDAFGDGVGVELYDDGRFMTFTGQSFVGHPLQLTDRQISINKLVEYIAGDKSASVGPQDAEHPMAKLTARRLHQDNLTYFRSLKRPEDPQNDTLNSCAFFAARAFAAGVFEETEEQIQNELRQIAESSGYCPGIDDTLRSGWQNGLAKPLQVIDDKWPELAQTIEEFNKIYFVVKDYGSQFKVCHFDTEIINNRPHQRIVAQDDKVFCKGERNKIITVGEKPTKNGTTPVYKDRANAWLDNRNRCEFQKVVFLPGRERVIPSSNKALLNDYNLWNGFAVDPKKGDCSLYLAHLRDNVCRGNADKYHWLIRWMARQVRNPDKVGESAIAIIGRKGVGKNVAAEGFGDLWGQHSLVVTDEHHVMGHFNAHLRDLCVLIADEAFYAKDPRQVNKLKTYITGTTIPIEGKGIDVVRAPNLLRIILLSNDRHIVDVTDDERRFFVLECGDAQRSNGRYFEAIRTQLKNDGYEALLYHLLNEVNLTGFDVRNPPHTEEHREQLIASLRGAKKFVHQCLEDGLLPTGRVLPDGTVAVNILSLAEYATEKRNRDWGQVTKKQLQDVLGKKGLGFEPGTAQRNFKHVDLKSGDGIRLTDGKKRHWVLPTLAECRKRWDERFGVYEWDADDAWEKPV